MQGLAISGVWQPGDVAKVLCVQKLIILQLYQECVHAEGEDVCSALRTVVVQVSVAERSPLGSV